MQSQKQQNDHRFLDKPFNITVIQVYAPTSNAKEAEVEQFYKSFQTARNKSSYTVTDVKQTAKTEQLELLRLR